MGCKLPLRLLTYLVAPVGLVPAVGGVVQRDNAGLALLLKHHQAFPPGPAAAPQQLQEHRDAHQQQPEAATETLCSGCFQRGEAFPKAGCGLEALMFGYLQILVNPG